MLLEIDFGGGAGTFEEDEVVGGGEGAVAVLDGGKEFFDAAEMVVTGGKLSPDFAVEDDLGAHVAGGFEEDGVHVDRGRDAGGLGLKGLGAADL